MYQYLEIVAEIPSTTVEGLSYLSMSIDNVDRKWPVVGIINEIINLPDNHSKIKLCIQPQYGGDVAPLSLLREGSVLTLSQGIHIPSQGELGKASLKRRWFEPAIKTSWQNTPIPKDNKTDLEYKRTFTHKEYVRIKLGEIPVAMEDHWFAYFDNDCLYWFRSWTGKGVFELYFEAQTNEAKVIKTIGTDDPSFDMSLRSVERLAGLMEGLIWHGGQIFDV